MSSTGLDGTTVVLHTSWRGRFAALLAPAILLTLGGYGAAVGGLRLVNGLLLAAGAVLFIIVALDYPLTARLGPDGIERHCLLRTERLGWGKVRAIARPGARQRIAGFSRSHLDDGEQRTAGRSGLVAEVGKRPYLLVDKVESRAEHEALARGLRAWAPGLAFRASVPAEGVAPTWLYKRRQNSTTGMVDWR